MSCVKATLYLCRQKRAELREYKKKKALKKKEKLEKVEQFREKEKERWKSFTHKVVRLPQITAFISFTVPLVLKVSWRSTQFKTKEKYFCCPRFSLWSGKRHPQLPDLQCSLCIIQVGVGTCNIGGKGMTDFVSPATKATAKQ